jgi:serine/threonine protein kinase
LALASILYIYNIDMRDVSLEAIKKWFKEMALMLFLLTFCSTVAWSEESDFIFGPGDEIKATNGKTYKVYSYLGMGGFGVVYKINSSPFVALKVVVDDLDTISSFEDFYAKNLFIKEISKDSNDFVRIFDVAFLMEKGKRIKRSLVVEMEVLKGKNLAENSKNLEIKPGLDEEELSKRLKLLEHFVDFGIRAIQVLSRHGAIHGDLNPKNIILTEEGEYKLFDFETMYIPGALKFNYDPEYSPYESFVLEPVKGATDFFTLGTSLTKLLLGSSLIAKYRDKLRHSSDHPFYDPHITFEEVLSNPKNFELMIRYFLGAVDVESRKIKNLDLRTRYIELANFALQVMSYKPQDRNFFWRGASYSYMGNEKSSYPFVGCNEALQSVNYIH